MIDITFRVKENIVENNYAEFVIEPLEEEYGATLKVSVKGTKEITGADVQGTDGAEVMNTEHYLGSLSGDKAKLEMELTVEKGYGYSLAEERIIETLGVIATDAVYSPIKRV